MQEDTLHGFGDSIKVSARAGSYQPARSGRVTGATLRLISTASC